MGKGETALGGTVLLGTPVFLAFQLCGLLIARRLLTRESGGVRLLFGSLLGSMLLQWCPIPFSFFLGFTVLSNLCGLGLACCFTVLALLFCKGEKRPDEKRTPLGLSAFMRRKFLWVVLLATLFFCWLVLHSFRYEDGHVFSSQATFGDMSMHLSFITSIAKQGTFPPMYSLLPECLLAYPFLSDSISSSLLLFGMPLRWAYFLPMAFAGAQVFFGLYLFVSRLMKSAKKAVFAWLFFFCNGGFGFLYFFESSEKFRSIFTGFYQTPTNYIDGNLHWVNVIVDMMLPQRATLFGWAVLFPVFYLLYRAVFEGERRYYLYAGVLAGLLPMIHTHSFLAVVLTCGAWLICSLLNGVHWWNLTAARVVKAMAVSGLAFLPLLQFLVRDTRREEGLLPLALCFVGLCVLLILFLLWKFARRSGLRRVAETWGVLLLSAAVLALPQLCFWTFRQVGGSGMLSGHFGWSIGEEQYLWFYLKNIGVVAILALFGLLTARTVETAKYTPALVIWFLAELVRFQPNQYDNNKLLYAAYAFFCCAAAEGLFRLFSKLRNRGFQAALAGSVLTIAMTSAVLTMGRECVASYEIFGDGAIRLSDFVQEETAPDSVILTDTRHNNEIAAISGRNIVCGSSSYLYFHGLPYYSYEEAVRKMYEQPKDSLSLYERCKVDYVLVSDFEQSSYQVDEQEINELFTLIYDDGVRRLYRVEDE